MRVERRGEGYLIAVPREAMEELHLADGAEVQVLPIRSKQSGTEHRHATVEEGLDAFRRTEGLHKNTYRELAKLPWSF